MADELPQPEGVKKVLRGGHSPEIGAATRIKPGQVLNPEGKNGQDWITQVFREVFQDKPFVAAQVRKIMKGKSAMAKVLLLEKALDRLEGKVAQPVQVSGELRVSLADEIRAARERAEAG